MENIKCTMEYIKSSFSKNTLMGVIPLALFVTLVSSLLFINMIKVSIETGFDSISLFYGVILVTGFPLSMFYILKIRYYMIGKEQLKYYSLFHPFGKTLYFKNYTGKIEISETGRSGSYKVIYLVDKSNRTSLKIMGLHYKKFGELSNAIPLRKIDFSPTTSQYFKLMFFERIKITENGVNEENEKRVASAQKIIQVFALIGISLFVIGTVIKMLTR